MLLFRCGSLGSSLRNSGYETNEQRQILVTLLTDSNNNRIVEVDPSDNPVWHYFTNVRPGSNPFAAHATTKNHWAWRQKLRQGDKPAAAVDDYLLLVKAYDSYVPFD